MPPFFSSGSGHAIRRKAGRWNSRSGGPIPCYGEEIPCFATEQGIASKALGLLLEMNPQTGQNGQKKPKNCKIPCSFPCFQGIRGSRLLH
jgi:hypothetical protein